MEFTERTISVPAEVADKIDRLLSGRKVSFSDFTAAVLICALDSLERQENNQEQITYSLSF